MMNNGAYDVAIVGGGPAGSTMVQAGWVERKLNESRPNPCIDPKFQSIRSGPEVIEALRRAGRGDLMRSPIDEPDSVR